MQIQGVPASPGIAVGPALLYLPDHTPISRAPLPPEQAANEWARITVALQLTHEQITEIRAVVAQRTSPEEAAIFDAHLLILQDEELLGDIRSHIFTDHLSAEAAITDAMAAYRTQLLAIDDEYLRARAADMEDISNRVVACLQGRRLNALTDLVQPSIIVARDLLPSDTAGLDPARTLALVIELGGPTAHTAILARQMGIPAIVAAAGITTLVGQAAATGNVTLAVDGARGFIEVDPPATTVTHYLAQRDTQARTQAALQASLLQPSITADGYQVDVVANIGHPRDLADITPGSVHGVGLFRTEFLFFDRAAPPTEDEQVAAYQEVGRFFPDGEVIIRTLDIGGDKTLPYLPQAHEENPFLGVRGLRLCLTEGFQPLFRMQLRAILRAASGGTRLKVMFPMVNHASELRAAREILREVTGELEAQGIAAAATLAHLPVGAMIETPAAAFAVDLLAREADFFSIGTNDLTQYVLAIDRMNAEMARHYTPFAPAVLRAIYAAVTTAHTHGKKIGMCGELASDPRAVALLMGLGLDEFSVAPQSIAEIKHVIRRQTLPGTAEVMRRAYGLENADAVVALLDAFLHQRVGT